MSRLARRANLAPKGGGGPTYAGFVTHITGLSGGVNSWSGGISGSGSGARITTAAAATGVMYGTSWNGRFNVGATTCRVVQHALPTEAEFNAQISSGRSMLTVTTDQGIQSFTGINRNGYTSLSESEGADAFNCTRLLFWVGADVGGSAYETDPSTGTGPTPYTW